MNENKISLSDIWDGWEVIGDLPEQQPKSGTVYRIKKKYEGKEVFCTARFIYIPATEEELKKDCLDYADDESLAEHYIEMKNAKVSQIKRLIALNDHPHIVSIFDYAVKRNSEISWIICVRMESLQKFDMEKAAQLSSESNDVRLEWEARKLGLDICDAILFAETQGRTITGIHPDDIYRDAAGNYKLDLFRAEELKEDSLYIAPEIYAGTQSTPSSALYSLGIMMYRMLNRGRFPGERIQSDGSPEEGTPEEERKDAFECRMRGEGYRRPEQASRELADILMKACASKPQLRYIDAAAMKLDLLNLPAVSFIEASENKSDQNRADTDFSASETDTWEDDSSQIYDQQKEQGFSKKKRSLRTCIILICCICFLGYGFKTWNLSEKNILQRSERTITAFASTLIHNIKSAVETETETELETSELFQSEASDNDTNTEAIQAEEPMESLETESQYEADTAEDSAAVQTTNPIKIAVGEEIFSRLSSDILELLAFDYTNTDEWKYYEENNALPTPDSCVVGIEFYKKEASSYYYTVGADYSEICSYLYKGYLYIALGGYEEYTIVDGDDYDTIQYNSTTIAVSSMEKDEATENTYLIITPYEANITLAEDSESVVDEILHYINAYLDEITYDYEEWEYFDENHLVPTPDSCIKDWVITYVEPDGNDDYYIYLLDKDTRKMFAAYEMILYKNYGVSLFTGSFYYKSEKIGTLYYSTPWSTRYGKMIISIYGGE
ncbi:MAG: hypothetical protein LUI87_06700 [Lachnospiraceae bacterium]|nr:hypothetical protein [Lachnospiraceae bacterium]